MQARPQRPLIGAIEAGGTKFVCGVGTGPDDLKAEIRFPTTTPQETLAKAVACLQDFSTQHGPLDAIGIGCFGPVDIRPQSPTWSQIAATPKPGWRGTNVSQPFQQAFNLPIGFNTDVNGAALGEWLWGAGKGLDTIVYLTIGTGIGGGVIAGGKLVHGLWHPEVGHMPLPRESDDTDFQGICPYHGGACAEGLASGPAMRARWGKPAQDLPPDHPAWDREARYLASLCVNLIALFSPERIILGGGVMEQRALLPLIRAHVSQRLKGYFPGLEKQGAIDTLIVPPALGPHAGLYGAIALGLQAAPKQR